MAEKWAYVVDLVIGFAVGVGCIYGLEAIGAAEKFVLVAAMLTIIGPAAMVGVIGDHYRRKAEAEGKDHDQLWR